MLIKFVHVIDIYAFRFVYFFLAFVGSMVRRFIVHNFCSRSASLNFIFSAASSDAVLVQDLGGGCKEYLFRIPTRSLDVVILAVSCRRRILTNRSAAGVFLTYFNFV